MAHPRSSELLKLPLVDTCIIQLGAQAILAAAFDGDLNWATVSASLECGLDPNEVADLAIWVSSLFVEEGDVSSAHEVFWDHMPPDVATSFQLDPVPTRYWEPICRGGEDGQHFLTLMCVEQGGLVNRLLLSDVYQCSKEEVMSLLGVSAEESSDEALVLAIDNAHDDRIQAIQSLLHAQCVSQACGLLVRIKPFADQKL